MAGFNIDNRVQTDWPSKGEIEFKQIEVRYLQGKVFPSLENNKNQPKLLTTKTTTGSNPVLKGISFKSTPSEKLGIVGRTGAGNFFFFLHIYWSDYVEKINTGKSSMMSK